jgi:hypothetical protein
MSVEAIIAIVTTAAVVILTLGVFVWAAYADGRDQQRYERPLCEWLRRNRGGRAGHGRTHG